MTNRKLFVHTVYVKRELSMVDQLRGLLRGNWVRVNGMKARLVSVNDKNVVLWMKSDQMLAVFR